MAKEKRPTNEELCNEFRALLTDGFYTGPDNSNGNGGLPQEMRERTKPWRNEVWKKFRELENRLCPHLEKKK